MDNQHTQAEELLVDELREQEVLAMTQRLRDLETTTEDADHSDA
jgi:hypothetical protein